jgi:hypothetical protein
MGEGYNMSTVKISPQSPENLLVILQLIKARIEYRKSMGFEVYSYNTQPDLDKVCPLCLEFASIPTYNGPGVKSFFPSHKWMTPGIQPYRLYKDSTYMVYPNVHEDHPEYEGRCHCMVTWLHPAQTLALRLSDEFREAIMPYV